MSKLKNIFPDKNPSTPVQIINDPELAEKGITLFVKRLDLIHPLISGNKWFKLKYNIKSVLADGYNTLLTFGGAYSNHIYSAAAAGKLLNLKTIGIIRGEETKPLNATLSFAKSQNMLLEFTDRITFRNYREGIGIENLKEKFGDFYLLPEGGTNDLAVKGCAEIVDDLIDDYDIICCSCGTGGTLAGLISGLKGEKKVVGYSILKGEDFLTRDVESLVYNYSGQSFGNWEINYKYHFGGYAKSNSSLLNFIDSFSRKNKLLIEPVYTGKMFYGIYDQILNNHFNEGISIIALHTGGIRDY